MESINRRRIIVGSLASLPLGFFGAEVFAAQSELKISHQAEDRILHLTLTGAKHNTNLVQINNYINKLHREDSDGLGVGDNRSHRQSANSNSSHMYSQKSKASKKADGPQSREQDMKNYASKLRKETANPLKPQTKLALAQPIPALVERLGRLLTDTAIAPPTHSLSRAKVLQREAVAVHGLDDLGDGYLLFSLGIAFGLSKEGAGLLQQVLEPAVGQGLLSGGR